MEVVNGLITLDVDADGVRVSRFLDKDISKMTAGYMISVKPDCYKVTQDGKSIDYSESYKQSESMKPFSAVILKNKTFIWYDPMRDVLNISFNDKADVTLSGGALKLIKMMTDITDTLSSFAKESEEADKTAFVQITEKDGQYNVQVEVVNIDKVLRQSARLSAKSLKDLLSQIMDMIKDLCRELCESLGKGYGDDD